MIGTLLGILGIIITVGFGLYSIWIYKKSKKNVSIEFQSKECYSLFRDDVNRLNIELIYNKQALSSTLILLKAKLLNNGQIDIDRNRIYSPLKIITTKDFIWLESTITTNPNGATTSIKLNSATEMELDWDLLKKDEFIEFEALVEIADKNKSDGEKVIDFYNGISFDFRITDLNSIQKEKQVSSRIKQRNLINKMSKLTAIFSIIIGIIFLSFDFLPSLNFLEKEIVKYRINIGGNEKTAYIYAINHDKVKLNIDGSKDEIELSIDEFNKSYKIKEVSQISSDPKGGLFNRIIGFVYIILGGLLFLLKLIKKKPLTGGK